MVSAFLSAALVSDLSTPFSALESRAASLLLTYFGGSGSGSARTIIAEDGFSNKLADIANVR